MRRPFLLLGAVSLVLAGGLALLLALKPVEPYYQGRALGRWLADLDLSTSSADQATRLEAQRAVRAMGTNALPRLAYMIRARDSIWRAGLLKALSHQSLLNLQLTPASTVRSRAVQGYYVLGAAADPGVPVLIQMLESERSPQVRSCVVLALGNIGPAARSAIPALVKACSDPDPEVRHNASSALANIQRYNDPANIFR